MQSSQDPQPDAVTYKLEGYHNHRGPEGQGVQIGLHSSENLHWEDKHP